MIDFENTLHAKPSGARPGLLLVGHGTRDERGVNEFLALAELVDRRLPLVTVRPGFLELAEPDIGDAVEELVAQGVDALVVAPVLLFAAGHAKQDIPQAVKEALRPHAKIAWSQAAHLGTHRLLIDHSALQYRQAVAQCAALPSSETLLLLVGRGSRDREATAEMLEFSRLRQRHGGLEHVATTFYAMAEPRLGDSLRQLQSHPCRRVVVQPHLLFSGQILDQIAQAVAAAGAQASHQEWILCDRLGPAPGVADVLVERYTQAVATQRS